MNFTYLDKAFQENDKAVLLYEVKDYENGFFLEVGAEVTVLDLMIDPKMPSGYSALIEAKNSGRQYFVDKDFLMPLDDFKKVYNKVIKMFMTSAGGSL